MIARAKQACPSKFIFPSQKLLIFGKGMKAGFVACILHRKIICCPVQNNYILKFQINDNILNSV